LHIFKSYFPIPFVKFIQRKLSILLYYFQFLLFVGANNIFPEDWAEYEAAIPVNERYDYMKAYGKRLRGELGEQGKRSFLFIIIITYIICILYTCIHMYVFYVYVLTKMYDDL
jgi:hypothetical protein